MINFKTGNLNSILILSLLDLEKTNLEKKKIVHEVNIPDKITIQELSNRMAMQASGIIKHLLGMGVVATRNHSIDADTA